VEQFLQEKFVRRELRLDVLRAQDVTAYVKSHVARLSPGRAKLLVTALRAFLRYLLHQGKILMDLSPCVLPVACWSLSDIPKSLPAGTVERVLAQCDRNTPIGRRNYAILLLLARL
jgi:site-specific recombinase XerC